MSAANKIEKASDSFFLSGFFVGKLQLLPIPYVSSVLRLVHLGLILIANLLWLIATRFYRDHSKKGEFWYAFADFKNQYLLSALLGLTAAILGVCAVFFPIIAIPSAWLFFISNAVWAVSEYHYLKNPYESDAPDLNGFQSTYLSYASVLTIAALIVALSTTLMIVFPSIAIPVLIASTFTTIGLGLLGTEYWLDFSYGTHKRTKAAERIVEVRQEERLSNSLQEESAPLHTKMYASPPKEEIITPPTPEPYRPA